MNLSTKRTTVDYANFVKTNARDFLRERGMRFETFAQLAHEQGFEDAQVLLTSSPVHGIATATSDVDLICVTPGVVSKGQMATQIHRDGQHCELLPVRAQDLALAFEDLRALARQPLPQRLSGYQRWDAAHAVRRKYLERIVYAVDTSERTDYLAHLPALESVVGAQDYDAFHQSRVCAVLAHRAGEQGGVRGHLMNACLAAMATALSLGGWVLSNKKWTLRRWRDAASPSMRIVDPELHADLGWLWESVSSPIAAQADIAWQLGQLEALGARLASLLGESPIATALPCAKKPETQAALDKRSAFLIGDDGCARLSATAGAGDVPGDFADLATLDARAAASLLRSARSGMLSFSLTAAAVTTAIQEDAHAAVE